MKSANVYPLHPKHLQNAIARRRAKAQGPIPPPVPQPAASTIRTTQRDFVNPVDYRHPHYFMGPFTKALALDDDATGTVPRQPTRRVARG